MIQKFRKSLFLYSFFGILLTGIIIAFVSVVPLVSKLRDSQKDQLVFAVKTKSLTVNEFLTRCKETASQITSRTRIRDMLEQYNLGKLPKDKLVSFCVPKLKDALAHSSNAVGMGRYDRFGNLVIQIEMPVPEEYCTIPDTPVSPVLSGPVPIDGQLYIVVAAPIINRDSERVGTDIVLFNTSGLEDLVRDYEGMGETGETVLGMVTSGKALQFYTPRKEIHQEKRHILSKPVNPFIEKAIRSASSLKKNPVVLSSGNIVAASYPIEQANWSMVVAMDTKELYASLNRQIFVLSLIIACLLVFGLAIMFLLLRPLTHSVLVHTDKLNEEIKEKEKNLEQLAQAENIRKLNEERMEALLKINQLNEDDEKKVINFSLEEAVRLTGSKVGYLHFFDDDQETIQLATWSFDALKQCNAEKDSHYPLEKAGIWADSLRQKEPVIHNDYPENPNRKGYPEGHFPVTRHMSIPIFDADRIVGVAGVGNKQEPYDESDVRQLSLFMNSMWGMLKQIRTESEKKSLQSQLQQAQKMEVVGRFSGGIAHDFNNILTTILGYSELLLATISKENVSLRESLQRIHNAGEKGASLTKQLLAFSRKQLLDAEVVDLNRVVTDLSQMIVRIIGEDVELSILSGSSTAPVLADVGQLEQILMNMAVNARDAMPEGGKFTINIDEIFLDDHVDQFKGLKPGAYIVLAFTDTGVGMSQEVKERVFEPFFTTKAPGKGTGLGLATIFGIVKQHQGHINVYSEPGRGTTFKIYLPRTDLKITEPAAKGEKINTSGTETILVVDDYPSIRDLIRDTLQPLGYQIIEAESGEDALEIYKNDANRIDMILTDVIMPKMNGPELATNVRVISQDMKIVYMSGYTDDFIQTHSDLQEGIDFISKPIIPSALEVSIRKILDR